MLDGNRYFAEFPDEEPAGRLPLSAALLTALAVIEREISGFVRTKAASENEGCKPADG